MSSSTTFRDESGRRRFLAQAARTFLGVGLLPVTDGLFAPLAKAASVPPVVAAGPKRVGRAKSVIYLYMGGGMSHLDTFDVKPGQSVQGPTPVVDTNVDGLKLSGYLPRLARQMDKVAVINSMSSTSGAHEQANYLQHTSYALRGTIKHPSMGAWIMRFQDRFNQSLPASVVVGDSSRHPGPGFFEAKFAPVVLNNPGAGLANAKRAGGIGEADFDRRLALSRNFDRQFVETYNIKDVRAYNSMYQDAVNLMKSADLKAFDIASEDKAVKTLYGESQFGQGCLLARRLVEHGVRFVEVSLGGWDTHTANFVKVPENCETLDRGLSALLYDLSQRGLLDETLVVLATEFGRTPDINGNEGRDHYPKAFSAMMAGGGVRGGTVYGRTDEHGREVIQGIVLPPDLNATIAVALGLPLEEKVFSPSRRPFTVADKGQPLMNLFA